MKGFLYLIHIIIFFFISLLSTNGTYVNRSRVGKEKHTLLVNGDTISLTNPTFSHGRSLKTQIIKFKFILIYLLIYIFICVII